jgi:hypothetical protein
MLNEPLCNIIVEYREKGYCILLHNIPLQRTFLPVTNILYISLFKIVNKYFMFVYYYEAVLKMFHHCSSLFHNKIFKKYSAELQDQKILPRKAGCGVPNNCLCA